MAVRCEQNCENIDSKTKAALSGQGNLLCQLRNADIDPESLAKQFMKAAGQGLSPKCFLCLTRWEALIRGALKLEDDKHKSPRVEDQVARGRERKVIGHNGTTKTRDAVNNLPKGNGKKHR